MTPGEIKEFITFLVNAGTPVVITAGVLALLWKHLPKYFENQIAVQNKQAEALGDFARALDRSNKVSLIVSRQLRTVHTSLRYASIAAEKYIEWNAKELGRKVDSDVVREIRNMRNAREGFNGGDGEGLS